MNRRIARPAHHRQRRPFVSHVRKRRFAGGHWDGASTVAGAVVRGF